MNIFISGRYVFLIILSCFTILFGSWLYNHYGVHNKNIKIINVLDKKMYNDCHIPGSEQVDLDNLENYARKLDKNIEIIVYCSNYFCTGSSFACKQLKNAGFKHVWAYEGGMAEWYQAELPYVGPAQIPYLKKRITPPLVEHEEGVDVISMADLAKKLGFTVQNRKAKN